MSVGEPQLATLVVVDASSVERSVQAKMGDAEVERLYRNYEILTENTADIKQHEKEYLEILAAVKGSDKGKRLASQFIVKFFKHFPHLAEQAIEAQLDLCEDDDLAIRKQAIKDLPLICKDSKEHTQRIADILAQLLQAYEPTELLMVQNSIVALLKVEPKGALSGLFSQIQQAQENELVRERCFKFLSSKVKHVGKEFITSEVEAYIVAECKKVLEDVNAEEFEQIMELLGGTHLGRTASGHSEIIDLIAAQVLTDSEFNIGESENIDRLIQCVGHALPYFSSAINSSAFVNYFCDNVLPKLDDIVKTSEDGDSKLEILKIFAELTIHCGLLENAEAKVKAIYECLIKFMPLPPIDQEADDSNYPVLEFSHVECLLFTFHKLGRQAPTFITADAAQLKEFRLRLQYFARLTQGYIKKLREAINGKSKAELELDENKIKLAALKTTSNINTIIKDLFHTPPSYKSIIHLSFQTRSQRSVTQIEATPTPAAVETGVKRHKPIVFDEKTDRPSDEKRAKSDHQKIYAPPSGKYSDKISNTNNGSNFSNGGRWRRGGRGGGRNFRNRGNNFRNGQFRKNRF